MHSAHEMLTRWPALDIAAKRARLQHSLHLSPGAITDALKGSADVAARAAAGLWRRDPSVWSVDTTVQKAITDRLGWMSSQVLMAESVDRLCTFADRLKSDGFTDVVLLGWAAPAWPRRFFVRAQRPRIFVRPSSASCQRWC